MTNTSESLWPDGIAVSDEAASAPVIHLRRQAALLGNHTHNIVEAEVETAAFGGEFVSVLKLVAPCLDGVRHELMRVTHGVECYPAVVRFPQPGRPNVTALDEDEFIKALTDVLTSDATTKAVAVLMEMSEPADVMGGQKKREETSP